MEGIMTQKKTNSSLSKTSPAPGLSLHRTSTQLVITKVKPKIRIIHIFAPEIIKTDVASFRELVQRLTGKPNSETKGTKRKGRGEDQIPIKRAAAASSATGELKKMEYSWGEYREKVSKMEMEDLMISNQRINGGNGSSSTTGGGGGGYLGQFSDFDGLMQELNCDQVFPLFPTENYNSQVDAALRSGRNY